MWAREFGGCGGVNVPLQAGEHFYIVTEPIPGLAPGLPVLRDRRRLRLLQGGRRQAPGRLLRAATPSPGAPRGIPEDFEFDELPEDFEHFAPLLAAAMRRVPALERPACRCSSTARRASRPTCAICSARRRSCAALRRGRLQLDRHPVGGRRGQGARRLDRRRPPADGPVGRRHPPLRAVPAQQALPARRTVRDRSACSTPCTGRTGRRDARAACASPRCTTGSPRPAPASARSRAGSAPTGSRTDGTTAAYEYSYGRQNWFAHSAAEHRAVREGVGFSTVLVRQVRAQGPRRAKRAPSGSAPTTSPSAGPRSSTPSGSTSAAASRPTSP